MMPAGEFTCLRQRQKQSGGLEVFHWREQRRNENKGYFGRTKAMHKRSLSARALAARGLTAGIFAALTFSLIGLSGSTAWSAPKDIRWGTGPAGSSGGKALVVLANILNKAMPEYRITVLPTPGAVGTVKGFATGEFDGFYGSDVALHEFATDSERFKGFKAKVKHMPVQSLWTYTLDCGLAIRASDAGKIKSWADLNGKPVFTGPAPFDTRKKDENALHALGIKHIYKEVALATAGSQLKNGTIDAMIIYAAGGRTPPPWLSQASLAVDWAPLNPTAKEVAELKAKGFGPKEIPISNIKKKDTSGKKVVLLPVWWGFDLGLNVPEADMYKMLKVIDAHADELAKLDPSFRQIAGGHFAEFQHQALEATWNLVPIHPGLAKYLKEKGQWDKKWDSNIAKAKM
jgi:TRAP transporter TAXI family solute receptor